MNFANYSRLNSCKYTDRICLIEREPAKNLRRTLTWREFNNETNKVANYLGNQVGIQKGDRVLHLLHNSLEWIIIYFGIIKIGGVVVPLNFRFISEDIKHAGQISKPVAFILGAEFLDIVSKIDLNMGSQLFPFEELQDAMILVKNGGIKEPNAVIKIADE